MATHVALLRGINVGGNNRVAMADLRETVASLGHTDVATYVQSGNVVFTAGGSGASDPPAMAGALEQAIAARLGVQPRVVVVSRDDLAQVIRDNPYPAEPNPKYVHAVFLSEEPGPEFTGKVAAAVSQSAQRGSRDEAAVVGRTLFLHTPDGFGTSDLAARLTRAGTSGTAGTARNWSTVTKLLALCDS